MNDLISIIKDRIVNNKVYRIGFIGDSITSTEWVHPNWREIIEYVLKEEFVKIIAEEKPTEEFPWRIPSWNIRTVNLGFDGSTSAHISELIEKHIPKSEKPYINMAIYLAGDNDRHFGISPDQFAVNIRNNIKQLREFGMETIALGTDIPTLSTGFNKAYQQYLKQLQLIQQDSGIQFVNLYDELKDVDLTPMFTFISEEGNDIAGIKPGGLDILHPNQLGNAYIAKAVLKTVFDIYFSPEKYMLSNNKGIMYPEY